MDLAIDTALFIRYIEKSTNTFFDKFCIDFEKIIVNNKNKFLLSEGLINHIEDKFVSKPKELFFFKSLLQHLSNRGINIATSSDDVISELFNNHVPKNLSILKFALLENDNVSITSNKIVYSEILKYNFHWIYFNLVCYNPLPVILRYLDFKNDNEIKNFFDNVFLVNTVGIVKVFDRYSNFGHKYFDSLNNRSVSFYTLAKKSDELLKVTDIKKSFKRSNIFITNRKNVLHERRVQMGNLFLEVDDDFCNIIVTNPTWKIELTYCEETSKGFSLKEGQFRNCTTSTPRRRR
jgi:hypothetical protein